MSAVQLVLDFDVDTDVHPVIVVMRERGMLDRHGRVRGVDFAAVWAELHPSDNDTPNRMP